MKIYILLFLLTCTLGLQAEDMVKKLSATKQKLVNAYDDAINQCKHKGDADKVKLLEKEREEFLKLINNSTVDQGFTVGKSKWFKYNTKKGWLNTKIELKKGQKVTITATGKWSPDNRKTRITADGIFVSAWEKVSFMRKVPHGKLLGYISSNPKKYIVIGAEKEFMCDDDGILHLGVNDRNAGDNKGKLKIHIEY